MVGGPQGRFTVETKENGSRVTNQIDRYVEETMLEAIGQRKDFSTDLNSYVNATKNAVQKAR